MTAPDATIRAWLDKADEYPTPTGAVGWVINGPELIALLSECTPHVSASVRPARVSDDMTTFYVRATLTFARSELTKETPMPGPSAPTTTVYGCSDDLVELDGAIYEEFGAYDRDSRLKFDNGAVLTVCYDRDGDGIWRIENPRDHPSVTITRCEDRLGYMNPDGDIYSDIAVVVGATSVRHKAVKRADS